jgi:hypothetical protein
MGDGAVERMKRDATGRRKSGGRGAPIQASAAAAAAAATTTTTNLLYSAKSFKKGVFFGTFFTQSFSSKH